MTEWNHERATRPGRGPVVRAGDAVLVTSVAVVAWRNLLGRPARFFWVLRDPLNPDA